MPFTIDLKEETASPEVKIAVKVAAASPEVKITVKVAAASPEAKITVKDAAACPAGKIKITSATSVTKKTHFPHLLYTLYLPVEQRVIRYKITNQVNILDRNIPVFIGSNQDKSDSANCLISPFQL